jgi:hypothetical protein
MTNRKMTAEPVIISTIKLTPELHRQLKAIAIEEDVTFSEVVRTALTEWLSKIIKR